MLAVHSEINLTFFALISGWGMGGNKNEMHFSIAQDGNSYMCITSSYDLVTFWVINVRSFASYGVI